MLISNYIFFFLSKSWQPWDDSKKKQIFRVMIDTMVKFRKAHARKKLRSESIENPA